MDLKYENSKICVAGLGGVGGFIGGALAKKYPKVAFYARGARKEAIQKNGLTIQSELMGDYQVKPEKCSENAGELGRMDYIFLSVKNYSLEEICRQIYPMIDDTTVIIPIMNGIDPSVRTRDYLGKGIVLKSLIYIVSGSGEDYRIVQNGNYATVHIGPANPAEKEKQAALQVNELLNGAGIKCIIDEDIEAAVWKKYILNCAFNILTAYYSADIGELRKDPDKVKEYRSLLEEAYLIGKREGINLPEDIAEEHFNQFLYKLNADATSSLRRDIDAGRPNELETFSGYLLKKGKQLGIELPVTAYFYEKLKIR